MTDDFNKDSIIRINVGNGKYYYDDLFKYECEFGFTKEGKSNVTCLADKTWSSIPTCTETGKALCYTHPSALTFNFKLKLSLGVVFLCAFIKSIVLFQFFTV